MRMPARFETVSRDDTTIVIRDVGPWDLHFTVTNDAEGVIVRLVVLPGQRVFYYDSDGAYGELVVSNGRFYGFATAN